MIKNNYPLSLILDILENIGTKKMFMKIDLRWGYNNIRIKKEDEWNVMRHFGHGQFLFSFSFIF